MDASKVAIIYKILILNGENSNFIFSDNILFNKDKTRMIYILSSAIENGQKVFEIPNTVTTLENGTIEQFSSLNKIIIPASVNNIADFRFFNGRITEVEIDEGNNTYMSDGNAIYSKDGKTLYMYYKTTSDMKIKDEVTTISGWAFYYHPGVQSLSIGRNVSKIDFDWRWGHCGIANNLRTVNIDNEKYKVEGQGIYIQDSNGNPKELMAIFGNIKQFDIPIGVNKIGACAFYDINMEKITLPDTLETIGAQAFEGSSITEIRIPNSVKNIGGNAFKSCRNLTRIEIDNKKESINGSPWGCDIGDRGIVWLR